jgi:putative flippase GtrA
MWMNPAEWPQPRRLVYGLLDDRRVRYVLAGAGASAVYYMVFTVGWTVFAGRIPYLALATVANLVTAVVTYRLYREGVFRMGRSGEDSNSRPDDGPRSGSGLGGFLRFYAICLWSLLVTLVGLPILVEVWKVPVLLAQALILVGSPALNYQVHRLWAFRRRG